MKEVTLQVPEDKKVEWREVNGITIPVLVDDVIKDDRPITERIKTFEDARCELGEDHPFVQAYQQLLEIATCEDYMSENFGYDMLAYLKLRIICAALNEGWQPQYTEDECRYYPWFCLYTQSEIDEMSEEEKARVVFRSSYSANADGGVAYAYAYNDSAYVSANIGSRLAFKTRELAEYCGKQFIEIWCQYAGFRNSEETEKENAERKTKSY